MFLNVRDTISIQYPTIESQSRTGGEWFLKILQTLDVEYLFGTTGGAMPDIQDAMTEVKSPAWIGSLHEFPTVAAAMGYAQASEKLAACLIDRVVGTANALGAFYGAHASFAPIMIFASQNLPAHPIGEKSNGTPRGYGYHYNSWQTPITTPWTKWRCEPSNLDMLPSSILKAAAIATTEPSGPVYVTLREDLMAKKVSSSPIPPFMRSSQSKITADLESIAAAAKLLVEADRPIICATNMGRHTSAVPKLVGLSETLGCGVLDGRRFLNFPMNHPLFLGFLPTFAYRNKDNFIEAADVLLAVENYYTPPMRPFERCEVIDILPDPAMLQGGSGGDYGGTYYPASSRLVGESTTILTELTMSVKDHLTQHQSKEEIEDRFQKNKTTHARILKEWAQEARKHFDENPVSAYRIAYELNNLWDENTVWIHNLISVRQPMMEGIHLNQAGTFFTNPSGHLGITAGAAYGAAVARPHDKVVAMMGDGDFIFGIPTAVLWTCSHHHIPVLYLIFNNECWGIEWHLILNSTLRLAPKSKNYEHVDLIEPKIEFKKMAESVGIHAETIEDPNEAQEKLKWGIDQVAKGKPALIDIHLKKYTEGPSSYSYIFKRPT